MGGHEDWIDHNEMNKDSMHLDDTALIATEQRHAQEVVTNETKKTDNNKDPENTTESVVLQMKGVNDPKSQNKTKQKLL